MKENELPVLEASNIDWDSDHDEFEKLPKQVKIKWDSRNWTISEVSDWLSLKFDWIFSSLDIQQIGTWENSGCSCCPSGCGCC